MEREDETMELKQPKLEFETIAKEYIAQFDEYPPMLTTLDVNNINYLKALRQAIRNNEPLTRNDLAKVFMPKMSDKNVVY